MRRMRQTQRPAALLALAALSAALVGCRAAPPTAGEATAQPTTEATPAPPADTATPVPPSGTPESIPTGTTQPPTAEPTRVIEQRGGEAVGVWHSDVPAESDLSADGRRIVVHTPEGLTLFDRESGETRRVDAAVQQVGPPPVSFGARISADGSTVIFWSNGLWISPDGTEFGCAEEPQPGEGCTELLIYDVAAGDIVEAVPVGNAYGLGMIAQAALSADGQVIAFAAIEIADRPGVWVYERGSGTFTQVAESGVAVDVSADGSAVAFATRDALAADDVNETFDAYVLDRAASEMTRISAAPGEDAQPSGADPFHEGVAPGIALSADGRWVAFVSRAVGLTDDAFIECTRYTGDVLPACQHIYLTDRETGDTELISVSSEGTPGDDVSQYPQVSADGQIVTFLSFAGNLIDGGSIQCEEYVDIACPQVYVRDRASGETLLLSAGQGGAAPDGPSFGSRLAADAGHVLVWSAARNLLDEPPSEPGAPGEQRVYLMQLLEP